MVLFLGFTAGILTSCASQPRSVAQPPASDLVWPSPPDKPRIAFLRYLRGPADIGQHYSVWRSMANWITGENGESLLLRKPFADAIDEDGNLCITDTDACQLYYCDFSRKQWRRYGGVGKTRFASPVAVARKSHVFYVADSELSKVFAFNDDGKPVFEIGEPLKRPVGLALAGGSLFVVDSQAHKVFIFGLDGRLESSFGRRGNGPGEFNFPTCAAADKLGHLFISDTLNSRVQVFDLHGKFLSQFGSNGDTPGHFARPKGVAVDAEGHVYVVDAMFDNFQIFNSDGKLLLAVGERGNGPGEFGLPSGIAIGADNRIFVVDTYNRRVQEFRYLEP